MSSVQFVAESIELLAREIRSLHEQLAAAEARLDAYAVADAQRHIDRAAASPPRRLFTVHSDLGGEFTYAAEDAAAAKAIHEKVWNEPAGPDGRHEPVDVVQRPDDEPLTVFDDEDGTLTKPCGEWARDPDFFCTTECD